MYCTRMDRRQFLGVSMGCLAGAAIWGGASAGAAPVDRTLWDPARAFRPVGRPLRVLPILMYRVPEPKPETSWKSWGGVQTHAAAAEEAARIANELAGLAARAPFAMEVLPVARVLTPEEAAAARGAVEADATIVYPATGSGAMLQACIPADGGLIFVRHKSGPVYYWYEALSTRYIQPDVPSAPASTPLTVDDVVVDDLDALLWRLQGLYAVANLRGTRILALGQAGGKYAAEAPQVARDRFGFDIQEVGYSDFEPRIRAALADPQIAAESELWAASYLALPQTHLATDRDFVVKSFVLYRVFHDLVRECGAQAFTVHGCMGTIIPMAQTTACLTLSLMNDEGFPAFCESDFVIIPAGLLLYHTAGRPVYLHNSTFPHDGMVTCAHCTGPRRMDGVRYEPTELLTHYESEYGVAPKVDMPVGQQVTFVDPEYATGRWVGMRGTVEANPDYAICRSQQDVRIEGDWRRLLNEVRDSHWVMAYGDHLRTVGYAAKRLGLRWDPLSEA